MSKKFKFGILLSVSYALVFCFFFREQLACLPSLGANEVGDFFAGVFGPLAFLWLVLGFLQQGEELQLNTKALEQQAKELHASVEQQKQLVEVTTKQFDFDQLEREFEKAKQINMSLPKFNVDVASLSGGNSDRLTVHLRVKNLGAIATNIFLHEETYLAEIHPQKITEVETNDERQIKFVFTAGDQLSENHVELPLRFFFETIDGKGESKTVFARFSKVANGNLTCSSIWDEEPDQRVDR